MFSRFESELVREYQQVIYQNVVKGMRVLVDARDKLGIPWGDADNTDIGRKLIEFNNTASLDTKLFTQYEPLIAKLWMDSGIKRAFERRREFQLVSRCLKQAVAPPSWSTVFPYVGYCGSRLVDVCEPDPYLSFFHVSLLKRGMK